MYLKDLLNFMCYRKILFLFVIYIFSENIVLADTYQENLLNNLEIKINKDKNILIANGINFSITSNDELPIFIKTNNIDGHLSNKLSLTGNVEIRCFGAIIKGNSIQYYKNSGDINSIGSAKLIFDNTVILGEKINFNINTFKGNAIYPKLHIISDSIFINADDVEILNKSEIIFNNVIYTDQSYEKKSWYSKAKSLYINFEKNKGSVKQNTLYFDEIPISTIPYFTFQLKNDPKSGLLMPTYGFNTRNQSGFEISTPYYLNINDDCDITISPKILSKRGLSLDTEFRYSGTNYVGISEFNYMHKDIITNKHRWAYRFAHDYNFDNGFYTNIELAEVSDNNYFKDLSSSIINQTSSNNYLPKQILIGWSNKYWEIYGQIHKFQTLQDIKTPTQTPFDKVPEISINGNYCDYKGIDCSLECKILSLKRKLHENDIESGSRFSLYPSISYPFMRSGYYFTPKFGLYYTNYSNNIFFNFLKYNEHANTIPIASLDTGASFMKEISLFGKNASQTIEPRIVYMYIPYCNQIGLNCFDTSIDNCNISNILTEDIYTNTIGRIPNANHITLSINSRWFEHQSGFDKISIICAKRWCFENRKVLLNTKDTLQIDDSDYMFSIKTFLQDSIKLDILSRYEYDNNQFFLSMIKASWLPKKLTNITLSCKDYNNKKQFSTSYQLPISKKLYSVGRIDFSQLSNIKKNLYYPCISQSVTGIEYKSNYWISRLIFQYSKFPKSNKSIFLQFEIFGLSSLGSNGIDILKKNISSHSLINEHNNSIFEIYE
ncbi:LPS-assembly protein LptD [Candidatus Kinetoplastibacterium sorsogonicusi]|uniref:LPS-assembly protein LptD n=1 Tax=Candidatus Kinetoplastidibacterium kentomonadis TaxID=1576550 RepID=A0A3S7J9A0_9PROT|nr:LPS assembly protein LptD [Candidatus Kinetoplastibacterium sorsogonicusi]AWD32248.1 LPS-assembly protein LptD [Candidatus Kinetoplastibacterium sorsogonicusi]